MKRFFAILLLLSGLSLAQTNVGSILATKLNKTRYVGITSLDIGGQVNAAYANCPATGCDIRVIDGSYSFSTAIVFGTAGKPIYLQCNPGSWSNGVTVAAPAKLIYAGTGAAVTFQSGISGGMSGCTLFGPGTATSSQGLLVQTQNSLFSQNDISNFNVGIQFGSNAYIDTFTQNFIHDNGVSGAGNIYAPGSLSSFGENITFNGGSISNKASAFAANCVNLQSGSDFHFNHVSFDQCGITLNNTGVHVDLIEPHFENPNGGSALPFVTIDINCQFCSFTTSDGYWYENTSGAGRTEFIKEQSTVANVENMVTINGGTYAPSENVAQLVNSTHGCCSAVTVDGIQNGIGGFTFTNMFGGNWANGSYSQFRGTINTSGKITSGGGFVGAIDGVLGGTTPAAGTVTTLKIGTLGSVLSDSRALIQATFNCGTTTTCSNTANGSNRLVFGQVTLASGTATVTGISPAFTSTSTFRCFTNDTATTPAASSAQNTSSSSITIKGGTTALVNYLCVGN